MDNIKKLIVDDSDPVSENNNTNVITNNTNKILLEIDYNTYNELLYSLRRYIDRLHIIISDIQNNTNGIQTQFFVNFYTEILQLTEDVLYKICKHKWETDHRDTLEGLVPYTYCDHCYSTKRDE